MDLLDKIKNKLSHFKNFYDVIRIIDPISSNVINTSTNGDKNSIEPILCYKFWNKNEKCKNCIALNAYLKKDTFIKIELKENKIFLIIATPVEYNNKLYIVELLKDISTNIFLTDNSNNITAKELMSTINESLYKDELTGAYNKRLIYEKLNKLLLKETNNLPISLLVIDLDYFKDINDLYGHIIGDNVLKDFSSVVFSCLRESDLFGRFGGEEFVVILDNSPIKNAKKIAERIRKTVESHLFEYNGLTINLTCSIGGYTIYDKKISDNEFLTLADKNLYIAKNSGRNTSLITSEK